MKYITDEKFRAKRGNLKYLDELRLLAKQNRNNPTLAESVLWNKIRTFEPHFLRQKPINRFIIDFYCPKLLLAIEIDGGYHQERKKYDDGRDEILRCMGIKTLRFSNEQVLNNISDVLLELENIIKVQIEELRPSFFQRRD